MGFGKLFISYCELRAFDWLRKLEVRTTPRTKNLYLRGRVSQGGL